MSYVVLSIIFGDAKHEMQSVFKFSDVLIALKSDGPPVEAFGGQDWYKLRCS